MSKEKKPRQVDPAACLHWGTTYSTKVNGRQVTACSRCGQWLEV